MYHYAHTLDDAAYFFVVEFSSSEGVLDAIQTEDEASCTGEILV